MNDTDYSIKIAKDLIGGTISNVFKSNQGGHWGIAVIKDGIPYRCWIDCDTEGNAAGHMKVEEIKPVKTG